MEQNWAELVEKEGPAVWRICRRLLGDGADAADAYQETFLSALQVVQRQRVWNWPGLLRRLAARRALDGLRRRLSRPDTAALWADGSDPVSRAAEPESIVFRDELAARLRRSLAKLPAAQAEAFCLRFFADLGQDDIAALLDINKGAVRVLLHRARSRLRELLDDDSRKPLAETRDVKA